jgi:hypothetical protein
MKEWVGGLRVVVPSLNPLTGKGIHYRSPCAGLSG